MDSSAPSGLRAVHHRPGADHRQRLLLPAGDGIVFDSSALVPVLLGSYGTAGLAAAFAHEFGHAVQAQVGPTQQDRLRDPDRYPSILIEAQADCDAGAFLAWASSGAAERVHVPPASLVRAVGAAARLPRPGNGVADRPDGARTRPGPARLRADRIPGRRRGLPRDDRRTPGADPRPGGGDHQPAVHAGPRSIRQRPYRPRLDDLGRATSWPDSTASRAARRRDHPRPGRSRTGRRRSVSSPRAPRWRWPPASAITGTASAQPVSPGPGPRRCSARPASTNSAPGRPTPTRRWT